MNEQELTELFTHFEALMRRDMMERFRSRSPFMNPHRGQGRIMSILKMEPEISQKELSYLLDMSKQGLAELLTKLETAEYITRSPSPEDGRMMIVKLTEKGRTAAEEMDFSDEDASSPFKCLSDEEQKTLGEYLQRMTDELESRNEGGNGRGRRGYGHGDFGHRGGRYRY